MAMPKFELKDGGRKHIIKVNKIMKNHRIAIQKALATAMTITRLFAEKRIIKNTTPYVNPIWARAQQPSTSGRLTSRTGKLKFMLRHNARMSNPLFGWTGWGNKLAKQKSVAFLSQIRAERLNRTTERYIGTIRVLISGHTMLMDTVRKQPLESLKTLAIRFQWEYGIRGDTSRKIFEPVAKRVEFNMRKLVKEKNDLIWRL